MARIWRGIATYLIEPGKTATSQPNYQSPILFFEGELWVYDARPSRGTQSLPAQDRLTRACSSLSTWRLWELASL